MRRLLLAALLALALWPAHATMLQPIVNDVHPSAGGSYTGPFDIITSNKLAGYSTRLLSSSYTGKALFLCTSSATTGCADISFDSTTHTLKASDITSQGCTLGSTCTVDIWYDQSGNGSGGGGTASGNDLKARLTSGRPVLNSNCPSSGLYCIAFVTNAGDGGGSDMGNGSGWSPATVTNVTYFNVSSSASGALAASFLAGASSASGESLRLDDNNAGGATGCSSGNCLRFICLSGVCASTIVVGVAADTSIHQNVAWFRNNSTNTIGIAKDQGTANTINSSESAAASFLSFCLGGPATTSAGCAAGAGGLGWGGNMEEWVMFSADESGSITGGVSANQRTFFGTP